MSNTEVRGSQESEVRSQKGAARRYVFFCLLTSVFCLPFVGCRIDMQDQPRYEYYEPGDKKFFPDGASSRATVEGTVPRQTGQYRDREDYLYTGKTTVAPAGASGAAAALASVRATIPGGASGAAATTATGEPDLFPIEIDKAALERG